MCSRDFYPVYKLNVSWRAVNGYIQCERCAPAAAVRMLAPRWIPACVFGRVTGGAALVIYDDVGVRDAALGWIKSILFSLVPILAGCPIVCRSS